MKKRKKLIPHALSCVIEFILRPRFVVTQNNEFGVCIWGITFVYYKRSSPLFYRDWQFDRPVNKREFGEYIWADFAGGFEESKPQPKEFPYGMWCVFDKQTNKLQGLEDPEQYEDSLPAVVSSAEWRFVPFAIRPCDVEDKLNDHQNSEYWRLRQ